ncbi:GNAT family N-acetyltransferase [Brachybacterium sp. JHP9]|uniref:GNAT family N-acetyltransferase n=1 Tax=Brachybacterium equifaecis TaxID=2910770 RepID=A0ABT0QYG7_9MICO|nr:GNAT family N-acetyltransferase [Brachybacterium equifaecis]MCL6422559.1 GNAT family N-acetyltransferase [Brachybacterium equifaecis]
MILLVDGGPDLESPGTSEPRGAVVGVARIVLPETPGAPAGLFSVWVDPAVRGRGAGRMLVEACIDRLHELAPGTRLRLDVRPENHVAQRLYERLGFGHIASGKPDGDDLVMERGAGPSRRHAVDLPTALVARYRAVDREEIGSSHLDSAAHLDALAASIRVQGIRQPLDLAVAEEFATLDGNHRLAAAIRVGLTEVPVHISRRHSSPKPEHARALRTEDRAILHSALAESERRSSGSA